jgi:hypothetical protein
MRTETAAVPEWIDALILGLNQKIESHAAIPYLELHSSKRGVAARALIGEYDAIRGVRDWLEGRRDAFTRRPGRLASALYYMCQPDNRLVLNPDLSAVYRAAYLETRDSVLCDVFFDMPADERRAAEPRLKRWPIANFSVDYVE